MQVDVVISFLKIERTGKGGEGMTQIPNCLTSAKFQQLGKESNYLYLDETNNLKLGSANESNIPEPTPLSEVKEKIEQYIDRWRELDYSGRANFGANIESVNTKIRKRDENFERTCSGSCMSYFGMGLIGQITASPNTVESVSGLGPSRSSRSSSDSRGLNVQELAPERIRLLT